MPHTLNQQSCTNMIDHTFDQHNHLAEKTAQMMGKNAVPKHHMLRIKHLKKLNNDLHNALQYSPFANIKDNLSVEYMDKNTIVLSTKHHSIAGYVKRMQKPLVQALRAHERFIGIRYVDIGVFVPSVKAKRKMPNPNAAQKFLQMRRMLNHHSGNAPK